MRTGHVKDS